MAKQLDKSAIITGNAITAGQISQSIDALTGIDAYDLTISGSLNINNAPITDLTASGNISSSGDIIGNDLLVRDGRFTRGTAEVEIIGSTSDGIIGTQTNHNLLLRRNNIEKLRIEETRTYFPQPLTVTGSILVSGSEAQAPHLNVIGNITSTHITASGNISASGGYVLAQYFAMNFPNTGTNTIQMSVPNRIDISPNNSTAIRASDSSVIINKDTSVNGDITSITNITASGNISSSGTIIATSGSFSHLVGNSPITIGSSVNFSQPITASGNLITSGSQTRKIRTVTLTAKGTGTLNAAQTIQPDDDIILIVGNTTPALTVNDFTFNCTDLFYAQASEVGRIVTIANVNSAVGSDLILGAPNPGETPYTANGSSTDGKFGGVCTTIGDEVNIVVLGLRTVAIYGSGI